jgi:hypothetical protein
VAGVARRLDRADAGPARGVGPDTSVASLVVRLGAYLPEDTLGTAFTIVLLVILLTVK